MKNLTLEKRQLCDIQGRLFELVLKNGYDCPFFIETFMNSKTAGALDDIYDRLHFRLVCPFYVVLYVIPAHGNLIFHALAPAGPFGFPAVDKNVHFFGLVLPICTQITMSL